MQIVYRAADITEAHLIAGMLQNEGIDAEVQGHFLQGGVGELGTMDFARVVVSEQDVARALPLLKRYEQAASEQARLSQKQGVRFDSGYWLACAIAIVVALIIITI